MGLDESELKQVLELEKDPEDPWHIPVSGLTVEEVYCVSRKRNRDNKAGTCVLSHI